MNLYKGLLLFSILCSALFFSSCELEDIITILEEASEAAAEAYSTSETREGIIELAEDQKGIYYTYGGETPEEGFDCSGLIYYCYGKFDYTLPRVSKNQYNEGEHISLYDAQPADIVAFYSPVSHVGLFIDSTTFIHAPKTGSVVQEASLEGYWGEQLTGVARYIDE
jgi:cell wall-associated NlpC family hydrolase